MAAATTAARRIFLGTTGGVSACAIYKAKYDPPHLVWDLDNTLLCSVTPIPTLKPHSHPIYNFIAYDYFDQIDDDFPFLDTNTPNTRTFWRPGARTALAVCGLFSVQHVYTTAQETYTDNILAQVDPERTIFQTVIHRDIAPHSVQTGKDLQLIILQAEEAAAAKNQETTANHNYTIGLHRMVLFDDRTKNFTPQQGENGVHVVPFQVAVPKKAIDLDDDITITWDDWVRESGEVARMVGISLLALLVPDVRPLLRWVRSHEHNERFPPRPSGQP